MKLFVILTFVLCTNILPGQEYKVIENVKYIAQYQYTYLEDSTNKATQKNLDMDLFIGDSLSLFQHSSMSLADSLLYAYRDLDPSQAAMKIMPVMMGNRPSFFTQYRVLKHKEQVPVTKLLEKINKLDIVVEEQTQFNWTLHPNEAFILNGLKCNKASVLFAGRKYVAWYTTEIPISDGPYKFSGLPGLIIKISDIAGNHTFTLTSFNTIAVSKQMILPLIEPVTISQKEYNKAKKDDLIRQMNKYTNPSKVSADVNELVRMEMRMRSINNYIELQ